MLNVFVRTAYRRIFFCGATSRRSLSSAFLGTADSVTPGISISSKRSCTSVARPSCQLSQEQLSTATRFGASSTGSCAKARYAEVPRFGAPAGTGPSALACDRPPFRRERVSRDGLSRRRGGLPDGGNGHQVQLVVNIGGRRQVAHRGLEGLVAHPMLHGSYIESPAQHSRCISQTKCLQIKFCRIGMCCSRFPVGDGNTNWQFGRCVCLRSSSMSSTGAGISRSSHRFG